MPPGNEVVLMAVTAATVGVAVGLAAGVRVGGVNGGRVGDGLGVTVMVGVGEGDREKRMLQEVASSMAAAATVKTTMICRFTLFCLQRTPVMIPLPKTILS